jgi:hypothetical protein
MLWGYKVIDTNKIIIIECYLWLSSSTNSCIKIIKEQSAPSIIDLRQGSQIFKKKLFKSAVRYNSSHQTIQAMNDNPLHLTNIYLIDRSWWQIYGEENSYSKQKHNQQYSSSRHGGVERYNTEEDWPKLLIWLKNTCKQKKKPE